MNSKQDALLAVSECLSQLPRLEIVYSECDSYRLSPDETAYAAQVLKELANGKSHRDAPGQRGHPPKSPHGPELLYWQLRYHTCGQYRESGALMRALMDSYPDAAISTLKKSHADIRRGIDDKRFAALLNRKKNR